jgi:hypothetical protein
MVLSAESQWHPCCDSKIDIFIGGEIKMLMVFFPERALEIQAAKPRESLAVSRRDLVARPRPEEANQRARPTRRVAFQAERSAD